MAGLVTPTPLFLKGMLMLAKVKQESRYGIITAFSGVEFIKTEWREVPAGKEDEARAHPLLLVQEITLEVKPEPVIVHPVKKAGTK